ncbi:uncharacterized protein LOC142230342 isoform X4 [Haematobia irritans]|uniref:uncharacterized protein LOC142230342 isoform X4 n=1 Tax=Haematobia irritans TaxID=7368 RepID=UPI003F503E6D
MELRRKASSTFSTFIMNPDEQLWKDQDSNYFLNQGYDQNTTIHYHHHHLSHQHMEYNY